jgi:hypothetical protein
MLICSTQITNPCYNRQLFCVVKSYSYIRNNIVSTVTRLRDGRPTHGSSILGRKNRLFSSAKRQHLLWFCLQWLAEVHSSRVKRPGHTADHSPTSGAAITNAGELYLPFPCVFTARTRTVLPLICLSSQSDHADDDSCLSALLHSHQCSAATSGLLFRTCQHRDAIPNPASHKTLAAMEGKRRGRAMYSPPCQINTLSSVLRGPNMIKSRA